VGLDQLRGDKRDRNSSLESSGLVNAPPGITGTEVPSDESDSDEDDDDDDELTVDEKQGIEGEVGEGENEDEDFDALYPRLMPEDAKALRQLKPNLAEAEVLIQQVRVPV
jgi:hypothetical protein